MWGIWAHSTVPYQEQKVTSYIRTFMGYLPQSNRDPAPIRDSDDPWDRYVPGLNSVVPLESTTAYNMMDVMGLTLVVDNNFAAGTMLVVYAPGFEIYESGASLQSFENPSTLGRTLSIHQYFATFVAKSSFIQGIVIA